jgi:hypothetical protein
MNSKLQTETVEIRPQRVFRCTHDKRNLTRKQVRKDRTGNYTCSFCQAPARDVTDTETGKEILRWL